MPALINNKISLILMQRNAFFIDNVNVNKGIDTKLHILKLIQLTFTFTDNDAENILSLFLRLTIARLNPEELLKQGYPEQ